VGYAVLVQLCLQFCVVQLSHLRLGLFRLAFCRPFCCVVGLILYFRVSLFPKHISAFAQPACKVILECRDSLSGGNQHMA